jgi:hypothetical protein
MPALVKYCSIRGCKGRHPVPWTPPELALLRARPAGFEPATNGLEMDKYMYSRCLIRAYAEKNEGLSVEEIDGGTNLGTVARYC